MVDESTPEHLRHINREDHETREVVDRLSSLNPPAQPVSRRRPRPAGSKKVVGQDELMHFFDRLAEPYVRYSDAAKQGLKAKLVALKRQDRADYERYLRQESKKLDELEMAYKERRVSRQQKEERVTIRRTHNIIERIIFWFYKRRQNEFFSDGRLDRSVMDHFDMTLRQAYMRVQQVVDPILNLHANGDFFLLHRKECDFEAYNLLSFLGSAHMGKAFQNLHVGESLKVSRQEIESLDSLARLLLFFDHQDGYQKKIIQALYFIAERLGQLTELSQVNRENLKLQKNSVLKILPDVKLLFSDCLREQQTRNRVLAAYSDYFGRRVHAPELLDHLGGDFKVESQELQLTSEAERFNHRQVQTLSKQENEGKNVLRSIEKLRSEFSLAEKVFEFLIEQSPARDKKIYEEDPLAYFNKHIQEFLDLFEDFLKKQKKIDLNDAGNHSSIWLIEEVPLESLNHLKNFPIKQDLIGKIKKMINQDTEIFRREIFNTNTELYKMFGKAIQYVQRFNAKIALHFAQLIEKEILKCLKNDPGLLSAKIKSDEISSKLSLFFDLENQIEEEKLLHSNLQMLGTQDEQKLYPVNSYYAFLKLGKIMLTFIANELHEPGLIKKVDSMNKIETRIKDVQRELDVLRFNP